VCVAAEVRFEERVVSASAGIHHVTAICRDPANNVAFYTGNAVPEWKNDLFFCDWNTGSLWRLNLQPPTYDTAGNLEMVTQPCRLYVRNGPDGALYFSDHHAIYRLGPPRS